MSNDFFTPDIIILIFFYAITFAVSYGAIKKELQNTKEMMHEFNKNSEKQNDLLRRELRDMKQEFSFKFDKNNKYGVRIGILENDLNTAWTKIDELKTCIEKEQDRQKR